jgi:Alkylmercury lyase
VDVDTRVRVQVYESFLDTGRPPTIEETGELLGLARDEVEASFERLEAGHVLVFAPGTKSIWMANPLSAFPTPFWVETPRGGHWGACIWDAFGVVAMLGGTGTVSTQCADCGDPIELTVEGGRLLADPDGVAHFAVPARHWWDNIGYT